MFPVRGISNFNTLKERPPLQKSNGISGEMANEVKSWENKPTHRRLPPKS